MLNVQYMQEMKCERKGFHKPHQWEVNVGPPPPADLPEPVWCLGLPRHLPARCGQPAGHNSHIWQATADPERETEWCPGNPAPSRYVEEATTETVNARPVELRDLPGIADALGPNGRLILNRIVPEVVARFAEATRHYGDSNPAALGLRGQFADIWRKIGPLKRALWDGEQLTREPPREILIDLIGHCLLTIQMLDEDQ